MLCSLRYAPEHPAHEKECYDAHKCGSRITSSASERVDTPRPEPTKRNVLRAHYVLLPNASSIVPCAEDRKASL